MPNIDNSYIAFAIYDHKSIYFFYYERKIKEVKVYSLLNNIDFSGFRNTEHILSNIK